MSVDTRRTVAEIAVEFPYAPRIFENLGIDYCCGGKRPLADACAQNRITVETVLAQLELAEAAVQDSRELAAKNSAARSTPDLIEQILTKHHGYVREATPRIQQMFAKVASKHGSNHPEVARAQQLFDSLAEELTVHLMKEEQILFPYILRMEESQLSGEPMPPSCFGTVRNPIAMMISEHDGAGELLRQIRLETNDLKAPDDACVTYQTLYRDVLAFEVDLHQHIHLENNILFPRAVAMEAGK